ncbi:predicted protein [Lichtheimia corymbifera JMRC:FSU:9682]|uniref:DUF202 domain-containing protein n=1 Tax=Lichtheimia corymbifera JMRC:FSU:9682 TaxID=1263082 RepID=A0A068RKY6_9FUNG|nr:predicted protein [Lichtheimia corymbifera JMRC:FSU:9682]
MATTSIQEVSAQTSSPQLSWNMPSSNSNNGRSSTLHLHDNDSRRTIQSPSPTARNSRASSIYNELCDKMSFASHSKKIAAKPFHLYTKYSQSLLLENTASVARDHLAITQLYNLSSEGQGHTHHKRLGQILGVIFVGFSLLFLYFGNARYFHAQHAMCKGYFPASRGSVFMASATVLGVLLVMLVVMVIDRAS